MIAARRAPSGLVHLVDAPSVAAANYWRRGPACDPESATSGGWTGRFPADSRRCHACLLTFPDQEPVLYATAVH